MGFRAAISRCTAKTDVPDHPQLIEALKASFPHSIVPVERGDEAVNCFMFALGLRPYDEIWRLAFHPDLGLPRDCLGAFARFLVDSRATQEVQTNEAHVSYLVLYSRHERVLHAGKVAARGRVISKWGEGWVWEHAPLEVPATYGNRLVYARVVPPYWLLPAFKLFVWDRAEDPTSLPNWFQAEVQTVREQLGLVQPEEPP